MLAQLLPWSQQCLSHLSAPHTPDVPPPRCHSSPASPARAFPIPLCSLPHDQAQSPAPGDMQVTSVTTRKLTVFFFPKGLKFGQSFVGSGGMDTGYAWMQVSQVTSYRDDAGVRVLGAQICTVGSRSSILTTASIGHSFELQLQEPEDPLLLPSGTRP